MILAKIGIQCNCMPFEINLTKILIDMSLKMLNKIVRSLTIFNKIEYQLNKYRYIKNVKLPFDDKIND